MIGHSHRGGYVAACGQSFDSHSLGHGHEESCHACNYDDHAEDENEEGYCEYCDRSYHENQDGSGKCPECDRTEKERETDTVAYCQPCRRRYMEPVDEAGEHSCPKCGLLPHERVAHQDDDNETNQPEENA